MTIENILLAYLGAAATVLIIIEILKWPKK